MWKKLLILAIFSALSAFPMCQFGSETGDLSAIYDADNGKEVSQDKSNQKLEKVLLNVEKEKQELLKVKLSIADALYFNGVKNYSDKYLELLNDYEITSRNGLILVKKIAEFSNFLDKNLDKLQCNYEDKLRLKLRFDEVKELSEKFGILIDKSDINTQDSNCYVLETNNELGVVILGFGFLNGSKIGMHWSIPEKDTVLSVVAVQPYASAAIVISGSINGIKPGMKAQITTI